MQRHVGGRRERTLLGSAAAAADRRAHEHDSNNYPLCRSCSLRPRDVSASEIRAKMIFFVYCARKLVVARRRRAAGQGWTAHSDGKSVAIIRRRTDADRLSRPDYCSRRPAAAAVGRVGERCDRTAVQLGCTVLRTHHGRLMHVWRHIATLSLMTFLTAAWYRDVC